MEKIPRLTDHPRWSLYRKIRRALARELEARGGEISAKAVDEHVAANMSKLASDMSALLEADRFARENNGVISPAALALFNEPEGRADHGN